MTRSTVTRRADLCVVLMLCIGIPGAALVAVPADLFIVSMTRAVWARAMTFIVAPNVGLAAGYWVAWRISWGTWRS